MKKILVTTIDVEPDCSPNWTYSNPLSFEGVSVGIRQRLQPLFDKYGISPTYLINNVVLEDESSVNVFRELKGSYELGTHLHPEFIEPMKEVYDYAGKKGVANCCFYPHEIEYAKIRSITELFTKSFGYAPVSFRAGRFSAGDNTIRSLVKLGYKIDTSVTPHMCWNDKSRQRPVNYRSAPEQPYLVSDTILPNGSQGKLLEVPVTIALRKTSLKQAIKKLVIHKTTKIRYEPVWLRPVFSDNDEIQWLLKATYETHKHERILVYNLMFHNVEVIPGLSPYTKTENDCDKYMQQLEMLFQSCESNNIESKTLSDLYDHFQP